MWPAEPAGFLTPRTVFGAWVAITGPVVHGHVVLATPSPALAEAVGLPSAGLAALARGDHRRTRRTAELS